jgi:hypothetical protein
MMRAHSFTVAPVVITSSMSNMVRPVKSVLHSKAPPDVFVAFFQRQFCLSWGRSVAKDTATVNRQIELISDNPGDFRRLIETAFAQTVGVQRERDDELIVRLQSRRKLVAQPAGNSQLMAVFEGVNDAGQPENHNEKQQSSD